MNGQTTIIKHRRRHSFVQVPNETARDSRLSWKATGLLCYLMSLPEDWKIRLSYLSTAKKDGRDGTRAGLAELEAAGYLTIRVLRDDANRIVGTVWEVSDFPDTEIPNTEKPNTEKPTLQIKSRQKQVLQIPPPPQTDRGGSGGEKQKNRTPKSKTPAPVAAEAGEGEAGQDQDETALLGVIVADSCQQFQPQIAAAARAAGLERVGIQKLADALAGALAAPEGDPARLKNRRNPARWLATTASALAAGEFVEGAAYLAAVAARQARQAANPKAQAHCQDEHRQRLAASAAAVAIDPAVVAAGLALMNRSRARAAA